MDQLGIENPDFIKMDIQGAEFEVLKGAENTLKKTLGMEIEVEILEMYKGQSLFGEITNYLSDFNFEFIDFVGTRRWLRDQHSELGQFIFADALFLKSPEIVSTGDFSIESKMNYLKILLIYRRFDLIYEFNKLSNGIETKSFEEFLKAIEPLRKNFDRVNKLNKLITIVLDFWS